MNEGKKTQHYYLVTENIARTIKMLGFKEPCVFMYDKLGMLGSYLQQNTIFEGINYNSGAYICSAPYRQQVFDWMLNEYDLDYDHFTEDNNEEWRYVLLPKSDAAIDALKKEANTQLCIYPSSRTAELFALEHMCELVKDYFYEPEVKN